MRSVWLVLIVVAGTAWAFAQGREEPGRDETYKLELNSSLVSVDVGVYDRNEKAVTDLSKDDFRVFEDGVLQPIQNFTPVSSGYRILLLIDHSGSMMRYWSFLLDGLNVFMKTLRPQDQVAIATFDNDVQVAMKWRSAIEGNTEKVSIAPNGRGTEIWSSLSWAVHEVSLSSGRKGVVVFTDGEDGGIGFKDAAKRASESEIPFYFVGMTPENTEGGVRMKDFAAATGGKAYFPKTANELAPLYSKIARDLGTAYTISYAPIKPPGDNKLRRIEIKTLDVRLHLTQSRSGYYAK